MGIAEDSFYGSSLRVWARDVLSDIPVLPFGSQSRISAQAILQAALEQGERTDGADLMWLDIQKQLAILSPIRSLPPELLIQILKEHTRVALYPHQPTVLSVCRLWRATALASSSCWYNLDFDIKYAQNSDGEKIIATIGDRIMHHIHLSGSSPISVSIRSDRVSSIVAMNPGIRTIKNYRDIARAVTRNSSKNNVMMDVARSLARYSRHFIEFAEFEDEYFRFMMMDPFVNYDRLTHLRIIWLHPFSRTLTFPVLQVLYYEDKFTLDFLSTITSPTLSTLILGGRISRRSVTRSLSSVLRRFPLLQRLVVTERTVFRDSAPFIRHNGVTDVTIIGLEYIDTEIVKEEDVETDLWEKRLEFLSNFPMMTSLTLSSCPNSEEGPISGSSMMDHIMSGVRHLSIEGSHFINERSHPRTSSVLKGFVNVEKLTLGYRNATSRFDWESPQAREPSKTLSPLSLDFLKCGSDVDSWYFPSLEELELRHVVLERGNDDLQKLLFALEERESLSRPVLVTMVDCKLDTSEQISAIIPDVHRYSFARFKARMGRGISA